MLRSYAACLRDFGKSDESDKIGHSYVKAAGIEWACKFGGVGSQVIASWGWNSVYQCDRDSYLEPPCWLCGGEGSEKEQWPLPALLFWRKLPLQLTLMPDTSVLPHMSLVPFKLLPQCWSSEWVSLSKSIHVWSLLEELPGTPEALPLDQSQSPLIFTARSYGDFSSWHLGPGWGWNHCSPTDISLQIVSTTCGCGTSPFRRF